MHTDFHPSALRPTKKRVAITATKEGQKRTEQWEKDMAMSAARRSLPVESCLRVLDFFKQMSWEIQSKSVFHVCFARELTW